MFEKSICRLTLFVEHAIMAHMYHDDLTTENYTITDRLQENLYKSCK